MTAKAPTPPPSHGPPDENTPTPPPPPPRPSCVRGLGPLPAIRPEHLHRDAVEALDIAGRTLAEMAGCLAEMAEKIAAEARRLDPAP